MNFARKLGLGALSALITLGCGGGDGKGGAPPQVAPEDKPVEAECSNSKDDDGDGFTDCADADCRLLGGTCTLAPPLDRTVASTMVEAAAFLYTGDDPLQQGVDPKVFDVRRLAIIAGRVVDARRVPLGGVTVSVREHPEFGFTRTRPDGRFDLAVNGGTHLAVHYEKKGYLPADRATDPRWQRYERASEVGLLEESKTTTGVAANADHAQTILGDAVADERGTHQAVAVVPLGTSAKAILPSGETKPLDQLTVHVTEYPLESADPAEGGHARFAPGTLPTTGGVSYGLGFTVEEAKTLGATSVLFSNKVSLYVEDLLGLPAGTPVPMGYYDAARGEWTPIPGGVVVKVLDVAGGVAKIDTDGNGQADDEPVLSSLSVSTEELRALGARYQAGQTLWRTPVTHFSSYSAQFNVAPPPGAVGPVLTGTSRRPVDIASRRGDALVEPRVAAQSIGVGGTPYSLYYQTNRMLEYGPGFEISLAVAGENLPPGLKGIHVSVAIAGQHIETDVPVAANAPFTYTWDGKDDLGRVMQGQQTAQVTVEYLYDPDVVPAKVFGAPGSNGPLDFNGAVAKFPYASLSTTFPVVLGIWDANGYDMGGFGFDVLHAYDPAAQTLFFGWGDTKSAQNVALTVEQPDKDFFYGSPDGVTVSGDGSVIITDDEQFNQDAFGRVLRVDSEGKASVLMGDGAPGAAGSVDLGSPQGVVVKSDGTVIVADYLNDAVRAIHPDGTLETLIGDIDTDNPVVKETLDDLDGLALGPREELYLANNDKIYRFEGNTLTPVAGGGSSTEEGVLASQALITSASGLAVDHDGTIFFAERGLDGMDGGHRVRKITPDGTVRTVAGSGSPGFSGDGQNALQARLDRPRGIALLPDGTLFIADQGNNRIREVTTDGLIFTVMGDGDAQLDSGQLASKVAIDSPDGIAAGPDGTLYIAGKTALYALSRALPSVGLTDTVLPSTDGRTLYKFDARGKHQATIDAITGVTELTFAYDGSGLLQSMTDADGHQTIVNRAGASSPDFILAPFGQKTRLQYDADGHLSTVQDDLNRSVTLGYDDQTKLLGSVQDPKAKKKGFAYEPSGRLLSVTDPTGYQETFTPSLVVPGDIGVQVDTSQGRSTVYSAGRATAATDVLSRGVKMPDGHELTWDDGLETQTTTSPDKTVVVTSLAPDNEFGAQALYPIGVDATTPGGRKLSVVIAPGKTLAEPGNALTLERWSETSTINGREYDEVYTRADRTWTTTTPMGRTTTATLDDHGRVTDASVPGLGETHYTYDPDGRVTQVTRSADGKQRVQTRTYRSDGLPDTVTDPLAQKTSYDWDLAGRIKNVTRPDANVIAWTFDDNDNVRTLTPPGRTAHTFDYDDGNLLTVSTPPAVSGATPSAGVTQYQYTGLDHELTEIDHSDGRRLLFDYDAVSGRPKAVTVGDVTETFGYDASTGALTSIGRNDGVTVKMGFDGPLWTSTEWTGAQLNANSIITTTYDENFWLASMTVKGQTVHYHHDDLDGLLTSAEGNNVTMTQTRDPATGMVTDSTLLAVTTAQQMSGFGELAGLSAAVSGTTEFSQTLERDDLGRITHVSEVQEGSSHEIDYTYDTLGRLQTATRDGSTTEYAYDANGNRETVTVDGAQTVSADYDEQDRVTAYGTSTFEQTAHGDLFRKTDGADTTELTYDELGNLRKAIVGTASGAKTINYYVDGFGRRVARNVNGRVYQWLYRDALRPVSEVNPDGIFSHFVYMNGDSAPDFMLRAGVPFRLIKDHLGSVRLVVNAQTGAIAQSLDYDEFGRVTNDTKPGFQPFGFAGGLYDPDTGLVHFGARDYDAETGRWVTKDPHGFGGGDTNVYAYCGGDPLDNVDPDGREPTQKSWLRRAGEKAIDVFVRDPIMCVLGSDCSPLGAALFVASMGVQGRIMKGFKFMGAGAELAAVLEFGGDDLVLGLNPGGALQRWAEKYGGRTFGKFSLPRGSFDTQIRSAMDQASAIRVNLDGVDPARLSGALSEFGEPIAGYTNYELFLLKTIPEYLQKARFYRNGIKVAPPF